MKNKSVLIVCLLLIVACKEEIIDTSLKQDNLVVNGFFTYNDSNWFNVSYLEDVFKVDSNTYNNDAKLIIEEPNGTVHLLSYPPNASFHDSIDKYNKGFYRINEPLSYQSGVYKLTVEVKGKNLITASDSIPMPVPIRTVSSGFDNESNSIFILNISDPALTNNYYAVSVSSRIFMENESELMVHTEYPECTNSFIDINAENITWQLFFSDKSFNGRVQNLELTTGGLTNSTFLDIENNHGYLKPEKEWVDSLVYSVKLYSISNAYYNYAISYYKQTQAEKDFYADPVTVFSNISGGYGIFAGYSISEVYFTYKHK